MLERVINHRKHPITPTMEARGGTVDREGDLHSEIEEYCKDHRWLPVRSSMHRPTTCNVGCTDFIIATDTGRTLWVEVKKRDTKLTTKQRDFIHWLELNQQEVCVVRSIEQFVMFTKGLFRSIT